MSHQTGIAPNKELQELFASCAQSEDIRFISVKIQNEELVIVGTERKRNKSWESDWTEDIILKYFEEDTPSYGFYRKVSDDWILVSWSPDSSPVRQKMLYASTKASLKNRFGSNRFVDELFATVLSDVSLEGYRRHLKSEESPGPLTNEEKEREEVKLASAVGSIGIDSRCETMKGLIFPFSTPLKEGLLAMKKEEKGLNYLQISIDTAKEMFNLEALEMDVAPKDLPKKVPTESPRYHLFRFKHTYEGEYKETYVFIYTMPGYNCTIKERMLYSSCSNNIVDVIMSLDIQIGKKIQVESGEELSEEFLLDELYPKQNLSKQKFARPPPPSRGKRRMIKSPPSS